MTEEEIKKHKADIDGMSQEDMARAWRFHKSGHVYFQNGPVHDHFAERFKELGGFSPAIPKKIGWDP